MLTVNEVSKLTGISVRALHHYDAIGLLKPAKVTEAGYRLYDGDTLDRLLNILLFRELQIPLKEIKEILDSPVFDQKEAIEQQIHLLELQLKHTEELISFARNIQQGGINVMNFNVFNKTEIEQYKEKTKYKTKPELEKTAGQLMALFSDIGSLRQLPPADPTVQDKIRKLQEFINENYYNCSDEILNGLGQLYVCDERMKNNIDKAGGEGTAAFVQQAITLIKQ